jgi:pSer/pThr/pTyr-binding forkhead associated (FHA) protein
VALKLGFLGVLYLFLLWIAWSATRDLRTSRSSSTLPDQGTGMYSASTAGVPAQRAPRLVVERAPGHAPGMIYDIGNGAVLGRGDAAEIRLSDPYASSRHARVLLQGSTVVLEDLGSTNGTYLNEEQLTGIAPLHTGDRVRIGDSEFTYEDG